MYETRIIEATDDGMKDAQNEAVAFLQKGEVIALPTETVYGLAADAFNPEAVAKIFAAKERPEFDPLIVHIASFQDLERVAIVPEDIRETIGKLSNEFWPGPLTIILPKTPQVPDLVTSGLPTVGRLGRGMQYVFGLAKDLNSLRGCGHIRPLRYAANTILD